MAEKTIENWRGLISPAIAQMTAAGLSGVEAKDIANLLSQLGIAGAILAK